MEIERKFTIRALPEHLEAYPFHSIEQAYLNTDPVIRIRREDDSYYLTYKGSGLLEREEYNLPLNETAYLHLRKKADGNIISKRRYLIPLKNPVFSSGAAPHAGQHDLTIELDVFEAPFAPLIIAEVEFEDRGTAEAFIPPDWFLEDVTFDKAYHNSNMSMRKFP